MPRIVACAHCHILQRITDVDPKTPLVPAYVEYSTGETYIYPAETGGPLMVPAFDPVLEDFVTKHDHGIPDFRFVNGQVINVWQVDQKTWDSIDVVTQIKSELVKQTGQFYAETDEYREGAAKCYNEHNNPDLSSGCRDYRSEDKRIGPAKYKVDGHVITVPPQFRHYLCDMCPYQQSIIQVELRRRRGAYDTNRRDAHRAKQRKRVKR